MIETSKGFINKYYLYPQDWAYVYVLYFEGFWESALQNCSSFTGFLKCHHYLLLWLRLFLRLDMNTYNYVNARNSSLAVHDAKVTEFIISSLKNMFYKGKAENHRALIRGSGGISILKD